MKTLFTTAAIVVALAAPAFAQGGNIHGTNPGVSPSTAAIALQG